MTANILFEEKDGYAIVRPEGDFNGAEENDALLHTFKDLTEKGFKSAIIDLRKVIYLNSGSIGVLLSGNALFKKKEGKVVLFGASDYLQNIFNVTKLNLAFDICRTEDEAIAAL